MPPVSSALAWTTRPASEDDIPLVQGLAERIWRASYAEMIPPEQIDFMLGWMYGAAEIAQELRAGVVWELALVDGEAAGFLSLGFETPARAKLHKLYLVPELQGTGLGQLLLGRVHELAAARGAQEIWLQVNKENTRAIRAYQRAGYVVASSAVFEIGHGFVMDDFIMQRACDSKSAA